MSLTNGETLYFDSHCLSLIDGNCEDVYQLKVGPRIGLSNKYEQYLNLPYRYVIGDIRKQKKGLMFLKI